MNGSNHWVGNIWSPETPENRYPTLTSIGDISNYNYQCSSWLVNDGSYLRLKNITIGYSLPKSVLDKQKVLSAVRFSITGTDLWEVSHINDGWDPRSSIDSIEYVALSLPPHSNIRCQRHLLKELTPQ